MCYQLQTSYGGTEAVIDDNCGISKFYRIANALSDELKINFINKVDDAETLDWNFKYKNYFLTLHYNIFNGVSIFPLSHSHSIVKQNNAVMEIANFLEKRAY